MPKGSEFLKNSVIQMGPFVKVKIHVESQSQSSTPPKGFTLQWQSQIRNSEGIKSKFSDWGCKKACQGFLLQFSRACNYILRLDK